jgi:hypothetical protein
MDLVFIAMSVAIFWLLVINAILGKRPRFTGRPWDDFTDPSSPADAFARTRDGLPRRPR